MWKILLLTLHISSVTCMGFGLGSSDYFSLSPFERSAFEGVPGIPGEQLYKMADGSVSDAIKLKARLSMSSGGAPAVPIAGALGMRTAAMAGGGAPPVLNAVTRGGLPGHSPGFYTYQQPQQFRAYPSMHYNLGNMAALALID